MKLELTIDPQAEETEDLLPFCEWLIPEIYSYATDPGKQRADLARKWNEYFQNLELPWPKDERGLSITPTFAYIVNAYFASLSAHKTQDSYLIEADANIVFPMTHITVESLARMINFGNADIKGYAFFDEVFDYFLELIDDLYEVWSGGDDIDADSDSDE